MMIQTFANATTIQLGRLHLTFYKRYATAVAFTEAYLHNSGFLSSLTVMGWQSTMMVEYHRPNTYVQLWSFQLPRFLWRIR